MIGASRATIPPNQSAITTTIETPYSFNQEIKLVSGGKFAKTETLSVFTRPLLELLLGADKELDVNPLFVTHHP